MKNIKKRKICVVSGTRAEYGQISSLLRLINNDKELDLQLIATGMHLSPEFGLTYQDIEKDGFEIYKKIENILSADTPSSISKSTAIGLIGFADAFNEILPDLIIVLGDRYELLAACIAAMFANIPIAHISGGETTVGAFDEAIRHSISKMSYWHFVATDEYRKRVIQLGENPDRVFNVGGITVDLIKKTKLLTKKDLEEKLGLKFGNKNLLITFHSSSLDYSSSKKHIKIILKVLSELSDIFFIFTLSNADTNGRIINEMIENFVNENTNCSICFTSMGSLNYLSTMQYVDGVLGNSSSGLTEAPTFKIGTVNIGDRQRGRLMAHSVINCDPDKNSIHNAIRKLYSKQFQNSLKIVTNPYGEGDATKNIFRVIKNKPLPKSIKKEFYDL